MKYFYSPSTNGFYLSAVHADIPDDAKEITKKLRDELISAQSNQSEIISDSQGFPILREKDPLPISVVLEAEKTDLRAMRAPMLDALTGIAGRAARAGNDALAAEADLLAEQLLDITDDAELNAATTYKAMQAAGVDAFRRIASSASEAFSATFKEFK